MSAVVRKPKRMSDEELKQAWKVRCCVPFVDGGIDAGVKETMSAFDELFSHIAFLDNERMAFMEWLEQKSAEGKVVALAAHNPAEKETE